MHLSKQKQFALLKLAAATVAVLFALWFFLIRPAQARLKQKTRAAAELVQKIDEKKMVIKRSDRIKAQMQADSQKLRSIEEQMVTGDIYLWIEKRLRDFEIPQQIEFTRYDPPQIIESDVPPKLPYKTASFGVAGTAAYHDLGRFIANLENSYPHILIRRLDVEPISVGANSKNEKLSFVIEMQVLVRSR